MVRRQRADWMTRWRFSNYAVSGSEWRPNPLATIIILFSGKSKHTSKQSCSKSKLLISHCIFAENNTPILTPDFLWLTVYCQMIRNRSCPCKSSAGAGSKVSNHLCPPLCKCMCNEAKKSKLNFANDPILQEWKNNYKGMHWTWKKMDIK